MGAKEIVLILYGLAYQILGAPAPDAVPQMSGTIGASVSSSSGGIPPLLTFKDGNVGVNFFGFKASAGLGGLLSGDASQGGLHAEAETPFGQKAGAGLGGMLDGNGGSAGGLYAGATAGGDVGAMAGLDGVAGLGGSAGRSYAGASAGGVGKSVVKQTVSSPAVGGTIINQNVQQSDAGRLSVPKEKIAPFTTGSVNLNNENAMAFSSSSASAGVNSQIALSPVPENNYVKQIVVPNYVEKTIKVPSYIEKTIRVPTVVEKTIRVPVPPTIISQEMPVEQPSRFDTKTKEVVFRKHGLPGVQKTMVYTRSKIYRQPWLHKRRIFREMMSGTPYYGGVMYGPVPDTSLDGFASVNANVGVNSFVGNGGYGLPPPPLPQPPSKTYTSTTTIQKRFNGNLVRDIFNIPIATLGAVSNLVGNIAKGTSGSVAVSKSYAVAI